MAGEGIAEGDWGEGMVGMTEPEASHGGVKVIEGAAERGEIWEGEAPTADEVWGACSGVVDGDDTGAVPGGDERCAPGGGLCRTVAHCR